VYLNASILGVTNTEAKDRLQEIVDFAELWEFMDTPVKRYSSGMYTRLGFAVAVHSDPDILLIDEVLAVGDATFQEKCMAKMSEFRSAGVTIILVSHAPNVVNDFCDRAIWLDHGRVAGDGRADDVVAEYLEQIHHGSGVGV
jgi:ABC-type polysaccharide/polyol phosphate transport system ATPase subunit